jgi:hypothetical protein
MRKTNSIMVVLLTSAALLAAGSTAAAGASASSEGTSTSARTTGLDDDNDTCGFDEFDVLESTRGVVGTIKYYYGDHVVITPHVDHKIWAGMWFTGWNGPAGWTDSPATSDYPLPGAPQYSLIGRLGNGPWQYIGNRDFTFHQEKEGYWQKVVLRTNDNNPGNGDGAFYATSNCS